MNLRLQGRVQVRDEDLRRAYHEIVLQERKKQEFTAAWILIRPRTPGESVQDLANDVELQLRQGRNFGELAQRFSTDRKTAVKGGLLGKFAPGKLPTAIDRALLSLEPGEHTVPIHVGDAYAIVQLVSRTPTELPTLEEARAELTERVYSDKMSQARRRWLDGLRKQMHVEIRL